MICCVEVVVVNIKVFCSYYSLQNYTYFEGFVQWTQAPIKFDAQSNYFALMWQYFIIGDKIMGVSI